MNYKYSVQIFNDDSSINAEENFKTIKDISKKYNIEPHILRDIIKMTENKKVKKFLHPNQQLIYKKIKIMTILPTFCLENKNI
jgi:hypothetical protein